MSIDNTTTTTNTEARADIEAGRAIADAALAPIGTNTTTDASPTSDAPKAVAKPAKAPSKPKADIDKADKADAPKGGLPWQPVGVAGRSARHLSAVPQAGNNGRMAAALLSATGYSVADHVGITDLHGPANGPATGCYYQRARIVAKPSLADSGGLVSWAAGLAALVGGRLEYSAPKPGNSLPGATRYRVVGYKPDMVAKHAAGRRGRVAAPAPKPGTAK